MATPVFLPGSLHVISLTNYKDANGNPDTAPVGVLPKYTIEPTAAGVLGVQNADGTQPVTFAAAFTGNVTFVGTLAYPNGDPVTLTPFICTIAAPEVKTADIVVT